GAARPSHAEPAAEGSAEREVGGSDLVLGLDSAHAEVLVPRELVQELRGGRDRVARVQELQPALRARRDQAPRERSRAADVAVDAGLRRRGLDLVLDREHLGGLAEVPAGAEGREVTVADLRLGGEALLDPRLGDIGRAAVHPRYEA